MIHYFKIGIVFFSCIFLFQCTKDSSDETKEEFVEQEDKVIISDPFYAVLNENSSLEEYWELFVKDAIRSGKPDPGEGRNVSIFFV